MAWTRVGWIAIRRPKVARSFLVYLLFSILFSSASASGFLAFLTVETMPSEKQAAAASGSRGKSLFNDVGPSTYRGKRNVHQLVKEIVDSTSNRLAAMEEAILIMEELSYDGEALQTITSTNLHVMHQMVHSTTWKRYRLKQFRALKKSMLSLIKAVLNLPLQVGQKNSRRKMKTGFDKWLNPPKKKNQSAKDVDLMVSGLEVASQCLSVFLLAAVGVCSGLLEPKVGLGFKCPAQYPRNDISLDTAVRSSFLKDGNPQRLLKQPFFGTAMIVAASPCNVFDKKAACLHNQHPERHLIKWDLYLLWKYTGQFV
eukprot:Gb_14758 [translate_table: standard]